VAGETRFILCVIDQPVADDSGGILLSQMKRVITMNHDHEHLRQLIREMGYGDQEEALMKAARPSIRVKVHRVGHEDEYKIAIGQSKIGGQADLAHDVGWVRVKKNYSPYSIGVPFIAQFNMQDVKPYDVENVLPERGLISLFGEPYKLYHTAVVVYSDENTALERKHYPVDVDEITTDAATERFSPCSVTFEPEVNLDFQQIPHLPELVNASNFVPRSNPTINRLLGVTSVQKDLQLQCELLSQFGKTWSLTEEQIESAKERKHEWRLLFQMDSEWFTYMKWREHGKICFYVRDFKTFDEAWLVW
jgi:uncharacterized protein YwqG